MKLICTILIQVLAFHAAVAQTGIGLEGGVTTNRFWGSDYYNKYHDAATGFSFGAVLNKKITDHFSLATGLYFERTGSRINDLYFEDPSGVNFIKGDLILDLNYLTLPVKAIYNFGKKRAFGLGAGVFGGYLLSARNRFQYESNNGGLPEKVSNKDNYHDLNFGALALASYRLYLKNSRSLVFSVEDHLGLTNISQLQDDSGKTHSVGFHASFLVDL